MSREKLPPSFLHHTLWDEIDDPILLGYTFILNRNLCGFPFPPKLDEKGAEQVKSLLKEALISNPSLTQPRYYGAEELDPKERELIFEHYLFENSPHEQSPHKGIVMDENGSFLALINYDDHLSLRWSLPRKTIGEGEKKLFALEETIAKRFPFAFSATFGYLTANPHFAGTALTFRAYLHLPALIYSDKLEAFLSEGKESGNVLRSLEPNEESFIGDLVILGAVQNVMSKSMKYALFDPTKEMAFIPLDSESKVKGKAAIDVVGSRLGKSGSAWLQAALIDLFGAGSILNVTGIITPIIFFFVVGWLYAVRELNKEFTVLVNEAA